MATILYQPRGNRPYFRIISLSYFSYGWFSAGGPPTLLHIYQRYLANHGRRRRRPMAYGNILHSPDHKTTHIVGYTHTLYVYD